MSRINKAIEFRKQIRANIHATRSLIRIDELTDDELETMRNLYDPYQTGYDYKEDQIFNYNNQLYKVIQNHTSLANWIPSELPALYLSIQPENVIPEWVQPTGGHDAYILDAIVIYQGEEWISTVADNVWKPGEYGWILYTQ